MRLRQSCLEFDFLYAQDCRELRLVHPNLTDHRLGRLLVEEELNDLLGLGADDGVEARMVQNPSWRSRLRKSPWPLEFVQRRPIRLERHL
jgi:hypothetical protein